MSVAGRTFRIFVSSTFNDLKAERNALQEQVFPELQRLCEANQCRFQAIDLRWGVSEEATLDQQTMNICLTELKRCQDVSPRPNFIILLGDRYGWIPLPPQIDASEFREILSQIGPEDKTLLEWDETRPDGGGGWYRLDTNAIPNEYVLRPRRDGVAEEKDYASWGDTENKLRSILLGAINRLGWPKDDVRRIKYECSATHQEIIDGALKLPDEREHVFAFLRSIQNIDDLPSGSDYNDVGVDKARALKDTIRQTKGITCFPYDVTWNGSELESHIDQFVADALKSLRGIIEEELAQLQQIDDLTQENLAHEDFGDERCRHFVGREKILDDIASYISGDQQSPVVIYGPSGAGKSALMAKAVMNAGSVDKCTYIVPRFIGATPESTDIRTLLRNLCLEISNAFGFESLKEQEMAAVSDSVTEDAIKRRDAIEKRYGVPDEYRHLVERFREFLLMVPQERRLILFIDALDQLSASDNAHSLNWLPSQLPANVKIVTSVLEREDDVGECLHSARLKFLEPALLRLADMPHEEGKQVLDQWLVEAYPEKKRSLTPVQMENVLIGFGKCPIPLYLKLAFEEARRWKSFDERPSGSDNAPGLAKDVPGIVGEMLHRLKDERQHGKVLVTTFLGLLSASRHGLSETEILELLSQDDGVMRDLKARSARSPEAKGIPTVVWLRLYHDLAPYLMERSADNTVLYNFYHRVVGETISTSHMSSESHKTLAEYFRRKADPMGDSSWSGRNVHGLAELPYQQTQSGSMWKELEATLTDLYFIEAKSKAGMVYDLISDYNRAEWVWPEKQLERQLETKRRAAINIYVDRLIECSGKPGRNPLPEPPPLVETRSAEPEADSNREWTPSDRVQAWEHFVRTHTRQLTRREEPVFQIAWNSAASGPVAESLAELERAGKGLSQDWLRLRNRPLFNLHPQCVQQLEGHVEAVNCVALTPDGMLAISGSSDGTLRIWDLVTGRCQRLLEVHTDRFEVYYCETGEKVIEHHSIEDVSITPDGSTAISISTDRKLRVWDVRTGVCKKVLNGHEAPVSITADGRRAISGSSDKTLRILDLATGACSQTLEGHDDLILAVSITSDGGYAVSGSSDRSLRVWDLAIGACMLVLEGHTDKVNAVSITPDGRRAVSGSSDKTVRVWDLVTGSCLLVLEGHTEEVRAVSLTPDGRRAVSAASISTRRIHSGVQIRDIRINSRNPVMVWSLDNGNCLQTLEGHTNWVLAVSITPDGGKAVSAGNDGSIRVWNLVAGSCAPVQSQHRASVNAVLVAPNGKLALSGSQDKTLRVWDLTSARCVHVLEGHMNEVSAISITPDSKFAISAEGRIKSSRSSMKNSGTLRVWDLETGACQKLLEGHGFMGAEVLSITPDGRQSVSGGLGRGLRVWDLATGSCLHVMEGHSGPINAMSITPDGRYVVSGSQDKTLRVWNLATGSCLCILEGHTESVETVSISPDGSIAISAGSDRTLRVWRLTTGECCLVLEGHTDRVLAVSITPDGRHAVSGSLDETLRVWDLATGACLKVLEGHTSTVRCVSITSDGLRTVSGSSDKTLKLWDLETGCCIATSEVGEVAVNSVEVHSSGLVAGMRSGKVAMYALNRYPLDGYCHREAIITAARVWSLDIGMAKVNLTAICPWCRGRFIVQDYWLGQEINCPLDGCTKPLKLNPFVAGHSDEDYEQLLWQGTERCRNNGSRTQEELCGHLIALVALLDRSGKSEEAAALALERDELLADYAAKKEAEIEAKKKADDMKSRHKELTTIRSQALDCYRRKDYAGAEAHLLRLIADQFESPGTHCHLARVCVVTDYLVKAILHVELAWKDRVEAPRYVVARILWFQILLSLLDGSPPNPFVGKLKTTLKSSDAFMNWDMVSVLNHVMPKLSEDDNAFLTALVAALSDKAHVAALDQFELWRNTSPQPLE